MRRTKVNFAKHYVEMVLVMFAGMGIFAGVLAGTAAAFGSSYGEVRADAPAVILLGMGLGMTGAMVLWMAWRGHSWQANRAMALSMIVPTALTVVLLASNAMTDLGDLLTIEHTVMFPAMLVAMLLHRSEYTGGHGGHAPERTLHAPERGPSVGHP